MLHLITGGSGFLGDLVARRLVAAGERVRILDVWEDPARLREIEFVPGSVLTRSAVAAALRGVQVVHHAAALVPLTKAGRGFRQVNVLGSQIVAEEALRAGVGCFVHVSSSAVFGAPRDVPINERTPLAPIDPYGRSKLDGELAVRHVFAGRDTPLVVVRPRTILAPGRAGIFDILFDWIHDGRRVYVIGDGRNRFQFVHAADLLDAYMLAVRGGRSCTWNVGTDRFATLGDALERLIAHAGTGSRIRHLPPTIAVGSLSLLDRLGLSPLAPWHYRTYHKPFFFDVQPVLDAGWRPRYSNDEMLRECYDWFVAHRAGPMHTQASSPHRRALRQRLLWVLKQFS